MNARIVYRYTRRMGLYKRNSVAFSPQANSGLYETEIIFIYKRTGSAFRFKILSSNTNT
jgi:hypothetical protein